MLSYLKADLGGRDDVLRQQGRERPRGIQVAERRRHRQPLRCVSGRHQGKGLYPRYLQTRLIRK